jgi:Tol biopolymer transport system component
MKRILIFCGAVALPAMVGVSTLRDADEGGASGALMEQQDTSVIVRRVYEGVLPEFWMNGPSPDGRYVTQNGWDTGDLAVLDLLSGQRRRVTQKGEGGWETSFAFSETSRFSPDGQRIAYSWFTEPGTYELRVIHVDGTNDRMVTRAGFEPEDPPPSYSSFYEWWPDLHGWSPDGQHILATLYYGEEKQELTLLSVADGSREVLHVKEGPDAFAAISPDGYYLAYGEMEDVFVQPLRGGDAVAVASGPSRDVLLGWTEQGSLLYLSDRELTEGVWRVPMRNGRPAGEAVLVAGDLWGMQPMGVAGNSLFYGIQSGAPRLHVVSLDLTRNRISGPPTPIEPQIRESSYPAWSPDGERLVYWVGRGKEARLILRSTGGTESRDVTPPSLTHDWDEIRWSQDGRCILISGTERESGREGYFAYTLATGEIEYLFSSADYKPQPGAIYQESFSHDWRSSRTVFVTPGGHRRRGRARAAVSPGSYRGGCVAALQTIRSFPRRSPPGFLGDHGAGYREDAESDVNRRWEPTNSAHGDVDGSGPRFFLRRRETHPPVDQRWPVLADRAPGQCADRESLPAQPLQSL